MAKQNSSDAAVQSTSNDVTVGPNCADKEEEGAKNKKSNDVGVPTAPPPPQARGKAPPNGSKTGKSSKDDDDNADIAALTEGLGGVSIAPKAEELRNVPESIKKVAALLESKKYKNIVILTGKRTHMYDFKVYSGDYALWCKDVHL